MVLSAALSRHISTGSSLSRSTRNALGGHYSSVDDAIFKLCSSNLHIKDVDGNVTIANSIRCFSSSGGDGGRNKNKDEKSAEDDPFGLHYQDRDQDADEGSTGNVGRKDALPPNYIRDVATGKFTGEIQREISKMDASLLKHKDVLEKEKQLVQRLTKTLDTDAETTMDHMANVARGVREQNAALNVIGRSIADVKQGMKSQLENGTEDKLGVTAPLSESEMQSLGKFMSKSATTNTEKDTVESLWNESDDLLPNIARKSSIKTGDQSASEENPDLDLEWMSAAAHRSMSDIDDDDLNDPFANLMPSDLNPARKVNRKKAKSIPKELLHHNNLSLLRRYMTPGGQIMNRVQTRLGAKDQRKIAKLAKRARNLGLVPYIGQWKVEDLGNLKEKDILENREWEKELLERGFIEQRSSVWKEKSKK